MSILTDYVKNHPDLFKDLPQEVIENFEYIDKHVNVYNEKKGQGWLLDNVIEGFSRGTQHYITVLHRIITSYSQEASKSPERK